MANDNVNFKWGSTIEGKTVEADDLVAINQSLDEAASADASAALLGSFYKGDKILGTTEADKLCLTEDLEVVGVTVGNVATGTKWGKGTNLATILKTILSKELGCTATNPSATISASSGAATATVEKGTVISNPVYTVRYTDGRYKGIPPYTSLDVAAGCDPTSATISGVTATATGTNPYTFEPGDITVLNTTTIFATVAYNKSSVTVTTNLENEITDEFNPEGPKPIYIKAGNAKTSNITYTPQLKWFIGSSNELAEGFTWTSELVRSLSLFNNWVTSKNANVVFPKGAKQQVIAVPAGKTFTAKDGAGATITGTFSIKETVTVTCGGTHTESYDVYIAPANAGLAADSVAVITLN